MTAEYQTLEEVFSHEGERIKNSRFVCDVSPADSEEAAMAFLEQIRAREPDAGHHCWAYRLGTGAGGRYRSSDDGEPGGSAGRPILAQLEGKEVTNAICVVSRWFGGVKLGVGGLMRAYGGAAANTLDLAPRRIVIPHCDLTVAFPYDCSGAAEAVLRENEMRPADADYGADVRWTLHLPVKDAEGLWQRLFDATSGRARRLDG